MNNEKSLFAQRLITAMQAKGYDPKPSILEREFNLRHNGKPVTLYGVRKWLLGMSINIILNILFAIVLSGCAIKDVVYHLNNDRLHDRRIQT